MLFLAKCLPIASRTLHLSAIFTCLMQLRCVLAVAHVLGAHCKSKSSFSLAEMIVNNYNYKRCFRFLLLANDFLSTVCVQCVHGHIRQYPQFFAVIFRCSVCENINCRLWAMESTSHNNAKIRWQNKRFGCVILLIAHCLAMSIWTANSKQ